MTSSKVLKILLQDGTLNSLVTVQDETWATGILFSCPRDKIDYLLAQNESTFFGVYLLLSNNMVYIGQSQNLKQRTKQHLIDKDWWESVVLITSNNDSLNKTDINYIEAVLIQKSIEAGTCDSDNKKSGNWDKVDRYRKIFLDQFIENSLFLLNFIGVKVFQKSKRKVKSIKIETIENKTKFQIKERQKKEVVEYVKSQGIDISGYYSYSKLIEKRNIYFLNPLTEKLKESMILILHNQKNHVINILRIPANKFSANDLVIRKDKPQYIFMEIDSRTFIERKSGKSFAKFRALPPLKY